MILATVNRIDLAPSSTGGLNNNNSFVLNQSGHSGCSTSAKGGQDTFANVSLSNIFDDDEEDIDIFGEHSMVGFITAIQMEQSTRNEAEVPGHLSGSFERKSPQKKMSSMKSLRAMGADSSTWQGSCNSFIGMGDELLDLSFSNNDLEEKVSDDLSLHTKNASFSCVSPTKRIPRNLSRKDIQMSNYKEKANNIKVIIHRQGRSTQPKVTVASSGSHQCFDEDKCKSNDLSPRKPIRRSVSSEDGEEFDRSTNEVSEAPTSRSTHSAGANHYKEDLAPKCPRRGKSPSRYVIRDDTTETKSPPSPKKKVMKIAIKDLEMYVSDTPQTNGKINKSVISASQYKMIVKAAEGTQMSKPSEKERFKISTNKAASMDFGISPYSFQSSIPNSIAVDCSDRSFSSMEDSSSSFIRETKLSPPPPTRRKNNIVPSKSSLLTTTKPKTMPQSATTSKMRKVVSSLDLSQAADETSSKIPLLRTTSCLAENNNNKDYLESKTAIMSPHVLSSKMTSPDKGSWKNLRRANSCSIMDKNISNIKVPKSPAPKYVLPPTSATMLPHRVSPTTATLSTPQCRKVVGAMDGGECIECHKQHDRPPTSPRRCRTPSTRESRSK